MAMAAMDVRNARLLAPVPEDGRRRPVEWAGPHCRTRLKVNIRFCVFSLSFSANQTTADLQLFGLPNDFCKV